MDREPHEVLGVARDASEEDVRAAYREMVKEHHPDVSDAEDAEERFVRIRDAYEEMRDRADGTAAGNGAGTGGGGKAGRAASESASAKSEHKRKRREKRKRWEDPWKADGEEEKGENERETRSRERKRSDDWRATTRTRGSQRVGELGYGWELFEQRDFFFVSKSGGRGRVYIDKDGRPRREKTLFSERSEAEDAYESHVERRENQRRTIPLGDGWRIVRNAGGYAVEGEEGYLGFGGETKDTPYWFRSTEDARSAYESRFERKERGVDVDADVDTDVDDATNKESIASRITIGAALLPFLVTVTVLNVFSSTFGLGTKGKNPYLTTAFVSVFLGALAVVLNRFFISYVLLFLSVWAGVEFVVMVAGPYTADEIDG